MIGIGSEVEGEGGLTPSRYTMAGSPLDKRSGHNFVTKKKSGRWLERDWGQFCGQEVCAGAGSLHPPQPRILATISPSVWAGRRPGEEVRMGRVLEDGCWASVQSVLCTV